MVLKITNSENKLYLLKLNIHKPYDLAFPLKGIPPEVYVYVHQKACTVIFSVVLFIIALHRK